MTARALLPALALACLAPATRGQSLLHHVKGLVKGEWVGLAVDTAGDVNGDGFVDVLVGAPGSHAGGVMSGDVRVISGADGSVLLDVAGQPLQHLGYVVAGVGDLNGDGVPDLAVGEPYADIMGPNSGRVLVISGSDGSLIHFFIGNSTFDYFGAHIGAAGDVNADGVPDLIVGAPQDQDPAGVAGGSATVFSGLDGSVLHVFFGKKENDNLGYGVDGAGDVNGDGYADLVIGAFGAKHDKGAVWVRSGLDGSTLLKLVGDEPLTLFGYTVAGAGDVDGDGAPDVIVGEPEVARARVFSGRDGSLIHTLNGAPGSYFGFPVDGAGDVDGFADLLAGAAAEDAHGKETGGARVFSGRDGALLLSFEGDSKGDLLGYSVAGAGDVNADGFADLIVGAYMDDPGHSDSGSAFVYSGCDLLGVPYCSPAVPNSTGQAGEITACGSAAADGGYFTLHARQLPPHQGGYFLTSLTQGFVAQPGGSQGNLCLGGGVARFAAQVQDSGAEGRMALRVDLTTMPTDPPQAVLPGETWHFQAWYRDVNPTPTSNFTDAVSVTFF